MNHVTDETLAAMALGEHDVDPAARDHVGGCPVCSLEVAELTQVDALLHRERAPADASSAVEARAVRLEPSAGLWTRILAETQDAPAAPAAPAVAASAPVVDLADRRAAASAAAASTSPPVRRRAGWIVAAAAACVLAGALVGHALWSGANEPSTQIVATTALTTLDATRQQEGTAELLDARGVRELRVDAATMPAGSGYVEVWLINADGKRMVSLGVMSTRREVFTVPSGAIEQGYTIVDLSREQFDDKPQHSGDSIMRGTLPA
ncbi:MAG: anti-sigma factor [Lapillicoccus sp.]